MTPEQARREVKVANVSFSDGYRAGQRDARAALADQIEALARWIDERLGFGFGGYDYEAVAESGVVQLRELAAIVRGQS